MQAIILAAGMGRRLGEWTKNQTKCMVPVNGVRLIDRVLGQLSKALTAACHHRCRLSRKSPS